MELDCKEINLSVIIPAYNVEDYFSACLDSLIKQRDIILEIIIVNDGSTDHSGEIADQFALRDKRIKVIHQKNSGLSVARNTGLKAAQGEYIAFINGDDWIQENTLYDLYKNAVLHKADVEMGQLLYCRQDGSIVKSSKSINKDFLNKPLPGKTCFIMLMETDFYVPMASAYLYRRKYLETIQVHFEEGIVDEDELWMPLILCQAERMIIVDLPFYFYQNPEKSITNATVYYRRVYSMIRIADKLLEFVDQFSFSGEDRELKSWLYVNFFRLYYNISELVLILKDSSIILPDHQFDHFEKCKNDMASKPLERCHNFIKASRAYLKEYNDWKNSECVINNTPTISCLCVTHHKPDMLQRVICCFNDQTWPNKQMVIVYEESDEQTHRFFTNRTFGDEYKIVKIEKDVKITLGELRNISIREANGSYVCQWDDDDWYDPDRLTEQMNFLTLQQKSGCVLSQWIMFDSISKKTFLSIRRLWEGSILCRRDVILQNPYPSLSRGEDTSVIETLFREGKLAIIDDMPELYVYTFHGNNSWNYGHFKELYDYSLELTDANSKEVQQVLSEYLPQDCE